MSDDSLAGPDTTEPTIPASLGAPTALDHARALPERMFSVAEMLETAKLPERTASVCLRPDLQAEHDRLLSELSRLVDPSGELLDDIDESTLGEQSATDRVRELAQEVRAVEVQMHSQSRYIRFRGLPQETAEQFEAEHKQDVKGSERDKQKARADFMDQLIARTAIAPELTVAEVQQMRQVLGVAAWSTVTSTCRAATYNTGVNIPFSSTVSQILADE